MYARCVQYSLRLGWRSTAETMADRAAALYRGQPGFLGMSVLIEERIGECAWLTTWATKADAEAAGGVFAPENHREFAALLQGPPYVRIYEVYEPAEGVGSGEWGVG